MSKIISFPKAKDLTYLFYEFLIEFNQVSIYVSIICWLIFSYYSLCFIRLICLPQHSYEYCILLFLNSALLSDQDLFPEYCQQISYY